ncbi:MAG: helicase-associated domain-containing protein [Chloroflexi bacterium]|nr:helicase-associated domain-containing protein [Chloroflexota bacterium]
MADEISALLDSYHSNTLWEMARAAGLEVKQGSKKLSKRDLLPKMRAEFFTEARVRASWEKLNKREREVLNRLLLRGGTVAKRIFQREIIRAGLATEAPELEKPKHSHYAYRSGVPYDRGAYAGEPTRVRSLVFEDVIARLTFQGLVFSKGTPLTSGKTLYKIQFHPAAVIYVPDAIRRYLPEPEPIPLTLADWQPERVEPSAPAVLLRDLYLYWDFVRRDEVSLIQSGLVSKRSLKAIDQVLLVPDRRLKDATREDQTSRLYLLRQLLETCGLVHKYKGMLRPVEKDPLCVPEFWGQSQTEQLSACLQAYLRLDEQNGFGDEINKYGPRYQHARQTVLAALKKRPPNAWLEIEDLLEQIQAQDVDFLFPEHGKVESHQGSRYYSYSYGYYYEDTKTLLEKFERSEAEFVSNCLASFLHQTGVVELGYDGDALKGFRLTPAGRAILGVESAEPTSQLQEEEMGKLIVQPSFQLLALGPVSLALLAQLYLFADRERADLGAFEYRLSRESVYRAQQLGMDVTGVLRFLERNCDTELPQNVRRSLEEWAVSHERIVFRTGVSLLQAADAALLAALADDPRTGEQLARTVAAEVSLVGNGRQKQLVAALVERGLFPAVSGAQPEAADRSIIVRQDGTIRPIHAVPSLHLRGRLSRLAEERDGGAWTLTPASVRRAGGSKAKVLRLLEELGNLHRGPFPAELTEQIKAWGGYYGRAAAETLTLIEFRDQATLEELIGHPDLQPYLIPFPTADRALAVVPTEKLPQVKEILARFGVQVKEGL